MSTRRRSSSQYTLFPSCPPVPPQSPDANEGIALVSTHIPSRSDSGSGRKPADRRIKSEAKEYRRHTTNAIFSSSTSTDISTRNTILRVMKQLRRQSTGTNRLIPLKLEAAALPSRMPSSTTRALPTTTIISSPSTSPIYLSSNGAGPEIPSRSSSKKSRPAPVTDLTIFPYTTEEWRRVMEEVKILYFKGQYKQCSMRSKQILDGIKDPYRVHPLYSIYLSFFAASSLEMTASSLHNHSSSKLPLFQQALFFYQKAESYLEYASISADPEVFIQASKRSSYSSNLPTHSNRTSRQIIHHASNSSISSSSSTNSARSSVDSIFSHRSPSTCSLASSIGSPDQDSPYCASSLKLHRRSSSISSRASNESFRAGHQQRRKKKVSFSSQLTILLSETEVATPVVTEQSALLDAFPSPPSQSSEFSSIVTTSTDSPTSDRATETTTTPSTYLLSRSLSRYRTDLTSLSTQLTYHITFIHACIALLSTTRKPRGSNAPDLTSNSLDDGISGFKGLASPASREESSRADLQERIKKLKEHGWRRKRFDGERYRVLCERALEEVQRSVIRI